MCLRNTAFINKLKIILLEILWLTDVKHSNMSVGALRNWKSDYTLGNVLTPQYERPLNRTTVTNRSTFNTALDCYRCVLFCFYDTYRAGDFMKIFSYGGYAILPVIGTSGYNVRPRKDINVRVGPYGLIFGHVFWQVPV